VNRSEAQIVCKAPEKKNVLRHAFCVKR